jgi:hypothetical protein
MKKATQVYVFWPSRRPQSVLREAILVNVPKVSLWPIAVKYPHQTPTIYHIQKKHKKIAMRPKPHGVFTVVLNA